MKFIKNLFRFMGPKVIYLAYGSNMLYSRIEKRIGKCKVIGNNFLLNKQLVFDCGGDSNFANLKSVNGQKVPVVMYEISTLQLRILDWYEGVGEKYGYSRIQSNGIDLSEPMSGKIFYYVSYALSPFVGISKDYLNTLIAGRKENNIYTEDLFGLKTIDAEMYQ